MNIDQDDLDCVLRIDTEKLLSSAIIGLINNHHFLYTELGDFLKKMKEQTQQIPAITSYQKFVIFILAITIFGDPCFYGDVAIR